MINTEFAVVKLSSIPTGKGTEQCVSSKRGECGNKRLNLLDPTPNDRKSKMDYTCNTKKKRISVGQSKYFSSNDI